MRRNVLNFLVDVVTLLAILAMIATGLLIRFVLPPGTGGRHGERGLTLWGMSRHDWGDLHFWVSVALGVLLVLHVALHWSWVCLMVSRSLGNRENAPLSSVKRNAYGLGFLLSLLIIFGGFTWYAYHAVQDTGSPQDPVENTESFGAIAPEAGREEDQEGAHELLQGSMTLAEVERATGVSVTTLKDELGLPQEIPADERLGRLGRRYGFDMNRVRRVVARNQFQAAP